FWIAECGFWIEELVFRRFQSKIRIPKSKIERGFRMRGYSRFRLLLLGGLLALAVFLASDGFAQTSAPAGGGSSAATEAAPKKGLIQLILSHPDPVFFTIAALSVIGLSLIIQ